jgi:Fe-Mn family superoxide dismutase
MTYTARDFRDRIGMEGFSKELLETHFALYEGYVKATNTLLEEIGDLRASGKPLGPAFAELNRRLGWEWDGMRLHELYFGNLSRAQPRKGGVPGQRTQSGIAAAFGTLDAWRAQFVAMGEMRGIGWVLLSADLDSDRFLTHWVDEHDRGHLAGTRPLLVMDVFEHAFLLDYGTRKAEYIDAFFANVDWAAVEARIP